MKKILIIGKDSYIGNHIQRWLEERNSEDYLIEQLDVQNGGWEEYDYSHVDIIVHVAGIVHRPDVTDWSLYRKVNVELPVRIAEIAKEQGVKQFVFFSTMAVYGVGKRLKSNIITQDTGTFPLGLYGKSKLMAEQKLRLLETRDFSVTIVRPPNVYGKGCKGGYINKYKSAVSKLPIIPFAYSEVKQSVIYIDNLCEFIRLVICNQLSGTFMPQDERAVSAVELMQQIAVSIGKKRKPSRLCGIGIYIFHFLPIVKKAYGGVAYEEKMTNYFENHYIVVPFAEGMKRTVGGE